MNCILEELTCRNEAWNKPDVNYKRSASLINFNKFFWNLVDIQFFLVAFIIFVFINHSLKKNYYVKTQ